MKRLLFAILTCGLAVSASAQPFRLAWNKLSTSSGIEMDVVRDGLVDSQGRLVVAGSTKLPNGKRVASISIFNRNRALIDYAEFPPSGDASTEATRLMEEEGIFYFFCTRTETVDNNETITIHKADAGLNLLGSNTIPGTDAPGKERITGSFFDEADAIFGVGLASESGQYCTFITKIDLPTLSITSLVLSGLTPTPVPPSITYGAGQTVVVGMNVANKGRVRGFTKQLASKWELNELDAFTVSSFISNVVAFGDSIYYTAAKNQDIEVENDETHWVGHDVIASTGMIVESIDFPSYVFQNRVQPGPLAVGPSGVHASFRVDGRTVVKRLSHNMNLLGTYEGGVTATPQSLLLDKFGEVFLGARLAQGSPNVLGVLKLSSASAMRFQHNQTDWDFVWSPHESGRAQHDASGDLFTWETDGTRMRLSCYQQAPVAVTDGGFQPKSGKLFRPSTPVTTNDRYAAGASITITQAPAHGTVTIGANGFFNYTSAPGYVGPDSFKYRLTKPELNPSTATVNLNVKPS